MSKFNRTQKRIFFILLAIATVTFILLIFPNAVASDDLAMVRVFEPDEAAQLPYTLNMLAPAESLVQSIKNFILYQYYFYGFPFFGFSAVSILPLKLLGGLGNTAQVMLVLRQVVSVLPMLIALLLLVYMQDEFRTYRSIVMFAFLLSVPAVLSNFFWWHVDSLVFLMIVLVIFFLKKDDLRFGKHFLIAAALTGCATATKLIGLYFFLAIATLLLIGFLQKKMPFKHLLKSGLLFIAVMVLAYLVSNPFLISYWARQEYQMIFTKQMGLLSEGYGVIYQKGLSQAWPLMHQYYGEWYFILAALGAAVWGALKGPNKLLHTVILTWAIPLSISVIWFTHFKYQYWLPVALPLFSCLVMLLPEKIDFKSPRELNWKANLSKLAALLLVLQFALNLGSNIPAYQARLTRAQDNPEIAFYNQAVNALGDLAEEPLKVYFDYRIYVPEKEGWILETSYDLLSYNYMQENDYDVLFLLQQRIADYLDPSASGIDTQQFANSQAFYADADTGRLQGYRLVFRNETGLVFVKEALAP
jgi:hypothetical protein